MDRGRHRSRHGGRVAAGRGAGRDARCALAAVRAMAKLVVMQAACQLSFLQVGGDVLVGHLLEACLEQVHFLVVCKDALSALRLVFVSTI